MISTAIISRFGCKGLLLLVTISCSHTKHDEIKDDEVESFLEYTKSYIATKHMNYLWHHMTDTSTSIVPLIDYIETNNIATNEFDLYQVFRQIILIKELQHYEVSQTMESDSINLAYLKIENEFDKLFEDEIIYDCFLKTPLVYRYVFLESGQVNQYAWVGIVSCKKLAWEQEADTLTLIDNKRTEYLVDSSSMNPLNPGRSLFRIR